MKQKFANRLYILVIFLSLFYSILITQTSKVQAAESCNFNCDEKKADQAVYLSCIKTKRNCLKSKLNEISHRKSSLTNEISLINGRINLQQLKIKQTLTEISKLETEIDDLSNQIENLNYSLDRLTDMLLERVRARYKRSRVSSLVLLFNVDSLRSLFLKQRYLDEAGKQTAELMKKAETQRLLYDQQKLKKEQVQIELEDKKMELETQRKELATQKSAQQRILAQTKNSEKVYQKLLAQAEAEIASFKTFTTSKGGGVIGPINSPDGWYFSQRDSRWAGAPIGSSGEKILNVGCLITSVAMVKKKFGENVTPAMIALNNGYFFANTAYMLQPFPAPAGYHYVNLRYSQATLKEEVAKNPVIVKLLAGPYGTHFVVIKTEKDGKFIMHDPWEGYDKNFTSYYSLGQISRISALRK